MNVTPQYAHEARIEWNTPDGTAPDRAWVRELTAYRGVRTGKISTGEMTRNGAIRSPSATTLLGYVVLEEDAPNLKKDGQLPGPLGHGKFARRAFYVEDTDPAPHETDADKLPERAVWTETVTTGTPSVSCHDAPTPADAAVLAERRDADADAGVSEA